MEGNKPVYNGFLLTGEEDYSKRKTIGRVALWKGNGKENSPVLTGEIVTQKGKYKLSLWEFKSKEAGL